MHKILKKCRISKEILINSAKSYCEQIKKWDDDKLIKIAIRQILDGLKGILGENLLKKMIRVSLTIESFKQVYRASGATGITDLERK